MSSPAQSCQNENLQEQGNISHLALVVLGKVLGALRQIRSSSCPSTYDDGRRTHPNPVKFP